MRPLVAMLLGASLLLCAGCATTQPQVHLGAQAQAASALDLWSKAVEVVSTRGDWVPGEVFTRVEIRGGDGKLESTREIWSQLTPAADGKSEPLVRITRATDDGRDVTAQEQERARQRMAKRDRGKADAPKKEFKHPFQADAQDQVRAEPTGETKTVGERVCAGFRWESPGPEGRVFGGTAWLDRESGVPREVIFTVAPLPDKVESLLTRVIFEDTPDGRWFAREMTIDAQGRFLFITKQVHTEMTLSAHWHKQ